MEKKLSKFDEEFIKCYDEDSNKGYILGVNVEYPKDLHNLRSNLPVLSARMEIIKCNNLVCNLRDKKIIYFSYRSSKTNIKSWTDTLKST